jgi:hypothetical protein
VKAARRLLGATTGGGVEGMFIRGGDGEDILNLFNVRSSRGK